MIVRDEADLLARCLESARGVVDETIVVDTGSRDATPEIASRFGALVLHAAWQDDFSAARNVSLQAASGDWVLVLDADEALAPESGGTIRAALHDPSVIGYHLPIVNDYGDGQTLACLVTRFFRRLPGVEFENRIHEQVLPSLLRHAERYGWRIAELNAPIVHVGYQADRLRAREKDRRNQRLFELQLRDRPDDLYSRYKYADFLRRLDDPKPATRGIHAAYRMLRRLPPDAARRLPYAPEIAALRALSLLAAGHVRKAFVVAGRAASLYGTTPHLSLVQGTLAQRLDRHEEAIEALSRCVEAAQRISQMPAQPGAVQEARRRLADSLARLGRWNDAEAVLRRAIEVDPGDVASAESLATRLSERGDLGGAFRLLAGVVQSNPDRPPAWLVGGAILVRSGAPSLAAHGEAWLRRALTLSPEGAVALDASRFLGESRFRSGDLLGALQNWNFHPADPRCRAGRALAAWALGLPDDHVLEAPDAIAAARYWISIAPAARRAEWLAVWRRQIPEIASLEPRDHAEASSREPPSASGGS